MAEGWDAADDDLERLLDFDDLEASIVPKSCKTLALPETEEARSKNSSTPHPSFSLGVHSHATRRDTVDSSAVAKGLRSLAVAPLGERPSSGSRQLDSQVVVDQTCRLDNEVAGSRADPVEIGSVGTPRIQLSSSRGKAGALSTYENRPRELLTVENSSILPAHGGSDDEQRFGEGNNHEANGGGYPNTTITKCRQGRGSAEPVIEEDVYPERVCEGNVSQGVGINPSGTNVQNGKSKDYAHSQGPRRAGSEFKGTEAPLPRSATSSGKAGKSLQITQEVPRKDVPSVSQRGFPGGHYDRCDEDTGQHEADPSQSEDTDGLPYRIPGPAGALQKNFRKRTAHGLFKTRRLSNDSASQSDTADFMEGPWIAAMDFLDSGGSTPLQQVMISALKSSSKHLEYIPEVVAIIKTVVPNGFGDVSVVLKDPTGTVNGCIHRSVLTESKYSHRFVPGAVLILRKVTVFSPNPYAHYVNITKQNVYKVFGSEVGVVRSQPRVIKEKFGNLQGNKDEGLANRSEQLLDTAVHALRVGDPLVLGTTSEHLKRQQDGNRLDTNRLNQTSIPRCTGARSDKSLQNATPAGTLEDSHNLHLPVAYRDVSHTKTSAQVQVTDMLTTQDLEEEATQEAVVAAKAKAAGWDLGEDVELLLNDDLDGFVF
ncbi:hypothetical protein MPTK1_6g08110 [Marchantia polymorpha subsp. ruderalis]|uniref:Homologous recombination OB-fold protein OB-fold domain-containing protein n=2 Tax=Marchantia polymorpha TaxID=3197 RepID=A0A176VMQ8_MARPO|nr:hypothetical protein AXG93_1175s1610 [Marchantia polymorpha subsp. ruderalis]PTQ37042.1 hypothetical protein MARPO_0060s0110 [Marchantia polymorpha]BBN14003.1 hypothetical protein Mp_6g08110 [Marchantia polymorpha subsp. ruderalis]|eukprot:PTQ37042.1 hypothetical protein MARPO_0060s0110 [Marchantia polymorpha]